MIGAEHLAPVPGRTAASGAGGRAGPALHHFPEGRGGVNAQQGQHKGQQTTLTRHDLVG